MVLKAFIWFKIVLVVKFLGLEVSVLKTIVFGLKDIHCKTPIILKGSLWKEPVKRPHHNGNSKEQILEERCRSNQ